MLTIEIGLGESGAMMAGLFEAELDQIDAGGQVEGQTETLGRFTVGLFGGSSGDEIRFHREQYLAILSTDPLRGNGRVVIDNLGRQRVILAGCCGDGLAAWRDHIRQIQAEEAHRAAKV